MGLRSEVPGLRSGVFDLQVKLRTERRMRKQLEIRLNQTAIDCPTTHASDTKDQTPDEDGMDTILAEQQSKYGKLEEFFLAIRYPLSRQNCDI
jgi:hypothetical protein